MKKLKLKYIPNCKICMWKDGDYNILCAAQGYKKVGEVYNNRLCKKLYDRIVEDKE